MRKFNKIKCTSVVRDRFTDKWGRKITLLGTHAFEYTIYIESTTITYVEKFTKGVLARKRLNELKRKL